MMEIAVYAFRNAACEASLDGLPRGGSLVILSINCRTVCSCREGDATDPNRGPKRGEQTDHEERRQSHGKRKRVEGRDTGANRR